MKRATRLTDIRIQLIDPDGTKTGEIHIPVQGRKFREFDHSTWGRKESLRRFHWYLAREDYSGLNAAYRAVTRHNCLAEAITGSLRGRRPNLTKARSLLSLWNTYGLWSLPQSLQTDLPMLADAVKQLALPYTGHTRTLYRGQSLDRFRAGVVGIGWTAKLDVAEQFARNRSTAGVILAAYISPENIAVRVADYIQTPKTDPAASEFEDEYLLDPRPVFANISIHSTVGIHG